MQKIPPENEILELMKKEHVPGDCNTLTKAMHFGTGATTMVLNAFLLDLGNRKKGSLSSQMAPMAFRLFHKSSIKSGGVGNLHLIG